MIEITTWVGDEVPCIARVTDYEPEEPPYRRGHPDTWEPGQTELLEWELFDPEKEFTPAELEAMASEEDLTRINDELLEEIEAEHQREMQP